MTYTLHSWAVSTLDLSLSLNVTLQSNRIGKVDTTITAPFAYEATIAIDLIAGANAYTVNFIIARIGLPAITVPPAAAVVVTSDGHSFRLLCSSKYSLASPTTTFTGTFNLTKLVLAVANNPTDLVRNVRIAGRLVNGSGMVIFNHSLIQTAENIKSTGGSSACLLANASAIQSDPYTFDLYTLK